MKRLLVFLLLCLVHSSCFCMDSSKSFIVTKESLKQALKLFPKPTETDSFPKQLYQQAQKETDTKKKTELLIKARLLCGRKRSELKEQLDALLINNDQFQSFCKRIEAASDAHNKANTASDAYTKSKNLADRMDIIQSISIAIQNYAHALTIFPAASTMIKSSLDDLSTIRNKHTITMRSETISQLNEALENCKKYMQQLEAKNRSPIPSSSSAPMIPTLSLQSLSSTEEEESFEEKTRRISFHTPTTPRKKKVPTTTANRPCSTSISSSDLQRSLATQAAAATLRRKQSALASQSTTAIETKKKPTKLENELKKYDQTKLDAVFESLVAPPTAPTTSCIEQKMPDKKNIAQHWYDSTINLIILLELALQLIPEPTDEIPHQKNSQCFSLLIFLLESLKKSHEAAKQNGINNAEINNQVKQLESTIKQKETDYCDKYYLKEGQAHIEETEKWMMKATPANAAQPLLKAYQHCIPALRTLQKSCKKDDELKKQAIRQTINLGEKLRTQLLTTPEFEEYFLLFDSLETEVQLTSKTEKFKQALQELPHNADFSSNVDNKTKEYWTSMQEQLEKMLRAQTIMPTPLGVQRLNHVNTLLTPLFSELSGLSITNKLSNEWPTMESRIATLLKQEE